MSEQDFKPGDVANSHVLSNDGKWLPLHQAGSPSEPQQSTKPAFFQQKWVQITGTALLSLFVGVALGTSNPETNTVTETTSIPATAEEQKQLEEDSSTLAQRQVELGEREAALEASKTELDPAGSCAKTSGASS
jgi:hypothetical protein